MSKETGGKGKRDEAEIRQNRAWLIANDYMSSMGKVASNFSSCIRAITMAEFKFGSESKQQTMHTCKQYILPWLKRSPSLKAVFYYAAESMYEEELEECESLTVSKLLTIFEPTEAASMLGLVYLARRIEKQCDAKEWERISSMMQIQMELGALIGGHMKGLGRGTGMLLGGIRALGYSLFAVNHPDQFKKYRRYLKNEGELFDLEYEMNTWSCNHLHLASLLVQNLGYGLQAGLGLGLGMAYKSVDSPKAWFMGLDEETQCWQVALSWIEALHCMNEMPDFVPVDHPLYIKPEYAEKLKNQARQILGKGSTFDWMERNRDDLTEELSIRLGLVFDKPDEEEDAIFKEIQDSEDYVDLSVN